MYQGFVCLSLVEGGWDLRTGKGKDLKESAAYPLKFGVAVAKHHMKYMKVSSLQWQEGVSVM